MVEYVCKRCGYTTTIISSLRNHLNRKNICLAILLDIPISELLSEYLPKVIILNDKTYPCNKCRRQFNSCGNKTKHQRICKVDPELNRITKLENIVLELSAKLEHALLNPSSITTTTTTNSNNTTTNNNNITLNVYHEGKYSNCDTSSIDYPLLISKLLSDPTCGILTYLEQKYFSVLHPENHILKLSSKSDLNSNTMYVHTSDGWDKRDKSNIYSELNTEAGLRIDKLVDSYSSGYNPLVSSILSISDIKHVQSTIDFITPTPDVLLGLDGLLIDGVL